MEPDETILSMGERWQAESYVWWVQLIDLKLKVSTAEQEREFYFTKLRDIEVMCQMPEVKQERVRLLY